MSRSALTTSLSEECVVPSSNVRSLAAGAVRQGRHSGSSGCHLSLIQFVPVRSTSPPVGVGHQPLETRLVPAKPMPVGVGRRTHDRGRERVIHADRRARARCSIEFHEEYGQPLRSGEAGAGRRGPAPAALQGAGRWALGVGTNVFSEIRWRAIGEFISNLAFSRAKPILA